MEQEQQNWIDAGPILRSWFEESSQVATSITFDPNDFAINVAQATEMSLVMGLGGDAPANFKFGPFFQFKDNLGTLSSVHGNGLGGMDVTPATVIQQINDEYQRIATPRPMGQSELFRLFNLLNWLQELDLNSNESEITDVFTSREQNDRNSPTVRLRACVLPNSLLTSWQDRLSEITSVQLIFGLAFGRVAGITLLFNPVIRILAKVDPGLNQNLDEHIAKINELEGSYAFKGSSVDQYVNFNFLRPCPPFGNCE